MITIDKCRICLKCRKNMCSILDKEDGITLINIISYTFCIMNFCENKVPDKICSSCRKKLIEAYNFKIEIEKSDMVLSEHTNVKRINFNNIDDVKLQFPIDINVPPQQRFTECFENNGSETIYYNNTIIKRLKQEPNSYESQTDQEFLNNIKIESNNDELYEMHDDYEPSSESDYENTLQLKKKSSKIVTTNLKKTSKKREYLIEKAIKPVCLKDVIIQHCNNKIKDGKKHKKKYATETSICPYCGKLLKSKYINIHILQHTNNKSFKCDQCSKLFLTQKYLNKHIKEHTEIRKFKCNQCIATFSIKSSLITHMLVHSEDKKHVCSICNKAFKRLSALKRHTLVHNFGKKAIECKLCPMTFHSEYFLRHHMRVHTGERPYKCELCSQPYSYKHDFNRHCLKKHGVFLKRRLINVMNEEVLQQERDLMKDLTLRARGVIKGDDVPSVFEGPLGALAFAQAMKAVKAKQIPITTT